MFMRNVAFFTVCGGGDDYELLLGSVEHHARIGRHLILDVSREPKSFRSLPGSVAWVRGAMDYGSGDWRTFRLATALNDARRRVLEIFPGIDFLVNLDSDEYYDGDVLQELFEAAVHEEVPRTFTFHTIHWRFLSGIACPLRYGPSEWHMRAWDVRADVVVQKNLAWPVHPNYNANPEHHPILTARLPHVEIRVDRPAHYHLHYAFKPTDDETAQTTIDGWAEGGEIVTRAANWPLALYEWSVFGESWKPSRRFLT